MIDFTVDCYLHLLEQLISGNYEFQTFSQFLVNPAGKVIILRHDVDDIKQNSLHFARLQSLRGIKGTYYFRVVPESFDERIISGISDFGHEIGYHYETMDTCNGDYEMAWDEFRRNLDIFRKIVPVATISMHGSPRSQFDNRSLWEKYDYRSLGIIGEPYFDVDFNKVAYFTDTGRRWNGSAVSIRDKVTSSYKFQFYSTKDIIKSINRLPDQIMFTFHPQRWTDRPLPWLAELIMQNIKNIGKSYIVSSKKEHEIK